MDTSGDYITIEEASEVTRKSISTIRRFVAAYKDTNDDIIRIDLNDRNRPLYRINKSFILAYFDVTRKTSKKNQNIIPPAKNSDLRKKIYSKYFYYKNAYIVMKRVLIIAICFSVALFIIFILLGMYYKAELLDRYNSEAQHFQKRIQNLEQEVDSTKTHYRDTLNRYDKYNERYNKKQDVEIKDIMEKLSQMEKLLKEK